ncbi:MAG: hypothetical protein JWN39_4307 [Ilumatobacteraceae bacterium]|nr:hypothetical protein [Ilumatobacteraceae bacterium]
MPPRVYSVLMQPSDCTVTDRTTLRRLPERGAHDRATIDGILDEAVTGHLAFVHDGTPFAIPTIHARVGSTLYVHGSAASRMLRSATDQTICYTATLIDGLVVARSAFHHSMNYRSVVVLGVPRRVTEADEKLAALNAVVDHVLPGRSSEVRDHTDKELRATSVLALSIDEASAKLRTGDPADDDEDMLGDVWAGVVPMHVHFGAPVAAADLRAGIAAPPSALGRQTRS